jgi:hypothetical protein
MESFLGIASVFLRFGRLAIHNKSPWSLLCNSSVSMGEPIKDPMFDMACLRMACGLTWDFVWPPWMVRARVALFVSNCA